jgi:hypothetical protein
LIARRQLDDGHWLTGEQRPPASSPFTATAYAVRTLQTFLPDEMSEERRNRVGRAKAWLEKTSPFDTEDRAYQLLGMFWAGTQPTVLRDAREALLREQRPDGGWAQIPGGTSDAYATGEALYSLAQAAGLPASHPAYQRGLKYLATTQKTDGTWFVRSRIPAEAPVSPPYFESGLPYGHHQFISAMATCWAAAALLLALPETEHAATLPDFAPLAPKNVPSWAAPVLFGGKTDLKRLLLRVEPEQRYEQGHHGFNDGCARSR